MPKIKTRRAAAKRFRITGTGKIIRRQAKTRHLLECKSGRQKREFGRDQIVSPSDVRRIKGMLPYG